MADPISFCRQFLNETSAIASLLDVAQIEAMVRELVSLRERKGRLFVIGLGGSAANASHAVNDFRKLCGIEAYAPTDNVAELTARANDEGIGKIFSCWIEESQPTKNDALMVLSVGGGTPSTSIGILDALALGMEKEMPIFGIVGRDGGATKSSEMGPDDCVIVIPTVTPERVTPHTESFQSVILHCLVSHPDLQRNPTKW